jgi:hypothetical protein
MRLAAACRYIVPAAEARGSLRLIEPLDGDYE